MELCRSLIEITLSLLMILFGNYRGSIDGHCLTDGSLDIRIETKFELDLYINCMGFFLPSLKKINT
jgi:hypothetical protein